MTVYAVGDVQGCLDELRTLLEQVGFDRGRDALWCVGDLVNRGPRSLETLRFFRDLGERAVCTLGNHDITLLALAAGAPARSDHQLHAVLDAPDRDELIEWLRHRPVLHHDPELGYAMVHAGLLPPWSLRRALELAGELEAFLRGGAWARELHLLYGPKPRRWRESLAGHKRLRFLLNAFTRMRYLDAEGRLELDCKRAPGRQPDGLRPWFEAPERRARDTRIVFGHWSTLGYHAGANVWGIDTGCVWGGGLTALRLDPAAPKMFRVPCQQRRRPSSNS